MEIKPNYYAILTAEVRYDKRLNANQKLLYAELTALANLHGFAWPSNKYLADLYNVSELTITRNIKILKDLKYITVKMDKTPKGTIRKIYINVKNKSESAINPPIKNDSTPPIKNDSTPPIKNDRCIYYSNNTRELIIQDYNNRELDISNNIDNRRDKNIELPTLSLIQKLGNDLEIKEHVLRKFYNYYRVRNFITKDNIQIDSGNLKNFLILWNDREIEYHKNSDSKIMEVEKPNWIIEYENELKEME